MKFIILKGFYKPKRILKILEEFEGDKDKALEKLEK